MHELNEKFEEIIGTYGREHAGYHAREAGWHVYYLTSRPPGIGTHPDGEIGRMHFVPRAPIPERPEVMAYGMLAYADPLTSGQIYQYDLYPADFAEVARYAFWIHEDKDDDEAERMWQEYNECSDEELQALAKRYDRLAEWVLELRARAND